jgi:hydroxyacylglutathione hydrolase
LVLLTLKNAKHKAARLPVHIGTESPEDMTRPNTVTQLTQNVTRIIAPNPSAMTFWGTNSYLLGDRSSTNTHAFILIDAGPNDPTHQQNIIDALPAGCRISHILITHAHLDHSAGAAALAQKTGAKVYAFGTGASGRSAQMQELAECGSAGGGEGMDAQFVPDRILKHGETLDTDAGLITALHTPGHMSNHMCFAYDDLIFSGDLIMGWSSSLISPPDGDAAEFRTSCALLLDRNIAKLLPGHGDPVENGHARIQDLLVHRAQREAQILTTLKSAQKAHSPLSLQDITLSVYAALDPRALPAAARNTFAHLIDLTNRNIVIAEPNLKQDAHFHLNIGTSQV